MNLMSRSPRNSRKQLEDHPIGVAVTIAVAAFGIAVGLYEKFRMPFYENKLESALARESELGAKAERLERELSAARRELEQARTAERTAASRAEGLERDLWSQRTASTNRISANGDSTRAEAPEFPLPPISVELLPGIALTNAEASRVALRLKRQLRELTLLESGKSMSTVPSGTYLFSHAYALGTERLANPDFPVRNSLPRHRNWGCFEFHRILDGKDFLIGFASETDAANVATLNGRDVVRIVLFPEPHRGPMTLLSVPADRIVTTKDRSLMEGTSEEVAVIDLAIG